MAKEKNISIDDARALVADEALWPRMRDFLWDFTPQIHASWLEGLRIPDGTAHSQRIKTYVLSSLGVAPVFHSFPKGDWSRLLLLDGATLEAIAKWLGAIVLADDLRRVMDGATVRKDAETRGEGAPSAENVVSTGLSMIDALLAPLPEALVSRLKLKLPKDTSAPAPLRLKPEACGKALAKLLKLKFPEAYKLCC